MTNQKVDHTADKCLSRIYRWKVSLLHICNMEHKISMRNELRINQSGKGDKSVDVLRCSTRVVCGEVVMVNQQDKYPSADN